MNRDVAVDGTNRCRVWTTGVLARFDHLRRCASSGTGGRGALIIISGVDYSPPRAKPVGKIVVP